LTPFDELENSMKNFVQPGNTLSVIAAAVAVGGAGVRQGVLFGVASHDAKVGEPLEITTCGVFSLPKATGTAWAVGDALYWNGTACTKATTAGNLFIGCAVSAQLSADAAGDVRLNGASPAALTA
jgi:predicted RecA/RadA family phage recombinase